MTPTLARLALVICAGLVLSAGAFADPPKDTKPADALKGPAVKDRQVPGVEGSFGEPGGERKRFIGENRLPPRVFRDAMDTVLSPDAPENLRVTPEQRDRYLGWMDNFQKDVGAYMREHQQEIRELREQMGDQFPGPGGQRRPGAKPSPDKPDRNDEMKPPADEKEMAAARERFQALMAGAPKIEDLYTRIWTELKPDQQKAVDEKIAEFRAQQAKEREDRYVKQKLGKKKGPGDQLPKPGDDRTPPPPRRGPNGQTLGPGAEQPVPGGNPDRPFARIDPERRDRLARLFSQLSPEQQDRVLDRLEQLMRENAKNPARPGKGKGPQGDGEPKPAPEPDDSMMPPQPPTKPE